MLRCLVENGSKTQLQKFSRNIDIHFNHSQWNGLIRGCLTASIKWNKSEGVSSRFKIGRASDRESYNGSDPIQTHLDPDGLRAT
jgi:hypothetical protein